VISLQTIALFGLMQFPTLLIAGIIGCLGETPWLKATFIWWSAFNLIGIFTYVGLAALYWVNANWHLL